MLCSTEILTHFRCGNCDGGWTIGDFEVRRIQYLIEFLYCPWCGIVHRIDDSEKSVYETL